MSKIKLNLRLSQDELLELIRFNITNWVDEEVFENGIEDVLREERLEETINSFTHDVQEILPYMEFRNDASKEQAEKLMHRAVRKMAVGM